MFTAYVDSGADVSILPKGDAELLGVNLYEGELWRLTGIGRAIVSAYLHEVMVKIGALEFPARIAFADLNEVPRIVGRLDIFRKFKVMFDEQNLQTTFQTYD
jgi:predicted aspartyl protease